ncbi:MAG: single-stranded DNA-binding protein [Bacilli bacterium]|nr:single-stranded DNA-binding protein [Bacilli bacterium]
MKCYIHHERRDNMLNQIVLVGRIVKTPELRTTENGKKTATVTLAVPRNYKNMNGEYDTDFLDCTLWTNVAENTVEYCQSGDMVGVKGRIQTRVITADDGSKKKKTEIVAEKVTFLAQSPNNKEKTDKKPAKKTVKSEK